MALVTIPGGGLWLPWLPGELGTVSMFSIDQIDSAAVPEAAGWAGQWPVGVGR